jgi:hypothetical protein
VSKAGIVRPIDVGVSDAEAFSPWLQSVLIDRHCKTVEVGDQFLSANDDALGGFCRKLTKAWCRPRSAGIDRIKLWTVTKEEAIAAYRYIALRCFTPLADYFPPPDAVLRCAPGVHVALGHVLGPTRGRRRLSPAEAAALVRRYNETPSGERWWFGGRNINEAKFRLELISRIERSVHEECGGQSVESVFGRSLGTIIEETLAAIAVAENIARVQRSTRTKLPNTAKETTGL